MLSFPNRSSRRSNPSDFDHDGQLQTACGSFRAQQGHLGQSPGSWLSIFNSRTACQWEQIHRTDPPGRLQLLPDAQGASVFGRLHVLAEPSAAPFRQPHLAHSETFRPGRLRLSPSLKVNEPKIGVVGKDLTASKAIAPPKTLQAPRTIYVIRSVCGRVLQIRCNAPTEAGSAEQVCLTAGNLVVPWRPYLGRRLFVLEKCTVAGSRLGDV